ncbi:gliding motility-associated C-terminal domain-containing protein [Flavobacterium sp. UGB4466]|uniref:gliding motility-associated C-terminal domain-containing protein n=1 Tax=Flavobacterium sp. UGB4466 TaxID=2730889 RepID=UPI00192B0C7C|nr:gliding motility-associated C-terminal domain-containing protein [Flavobacterium sp. UGB4466]
MRILNLKSRLVLLLIPCFATSQIINTGELFVASNTPVSFVNAFDNKSKAVLINDGELFLYSHINNDGLISFSSGNSKGITRLRGVSGHQNISGNIPIELYDVEFNNNSNGNAATFQVSNYLSISGMADFKEGIIDDDSFGGLVIFENGSGCVNVSDKSFVNGEVMKNGNNDFNFPVGDELKYHSVGISALKMNTDAFSGKYSQKDAGILYPFKNKTSNILVVNDKEYWTVKKMGSTTDLILTLSWDEAVTPASIIESPSEIRIVRWDSAKNSWLDEGGVVNKDDKTISSPVSVSGNVIFTTAKVKKTDSFVVYNAVSPNKDGLNDYLRIEGLDGTENELEIYDNRGIKVFRTREYGSNENVFNGFANVQNVFLKNERLPDGTYFYILSVAKDNFTTKQVGYLYLSQ